MTRLAPEKILERMECAAEEFRAAKVIINELAIEHKRREARTSIIISSKTNHLIKNEVLRQHLDVCCQDPKFKPTVDFIANCVYLEHEEFMEKWDSANLAAKMAKEEHEMWSKQLMWDLSKNKLTAAELMKL